MRKTHVRLLIALVMLTSFGAVMAQESNDAVTEETRRV